MLTELFYFILLNKLKKVMSLRFNELKYFESQTFLKQIIKTYQGVYQLTLFKMLKIIQVNKIAAELKCIRR